jgi:hypothetical protein
MAGPRLAIDTARHTRGIAAQRILVVALLFAENPPQDPILHAGPPIRTPPPSVSGYSVGKSSCASRGGGVGEGGLFHLFLGHNPSTLGIVVSLLG